MEFIHTIEVVKQDLPIINDEYNNWIIALSSMKNKDQIRAYKFFKEIIKLLTDSYKINYLKIIVNGKKLSIDNILLFDLKLAINELRIAKPVITENKITIKLRENIEKTNQILPENTQEFTSNYLYILKNLDEKLPSNLKNFYFYQIKIPDNELFSLMKDEYGNLFKIIKKQYLPYLKYIDLSNTNFDYADLRNIDLSFTNIKKINFNTLYKHSIENTNLQNVALINHELDGICAKGANLLGTFLSINIDTTNIEMAKIDTNILLFNNENKIISNANLNKTRNYYELKPSLHL